jgi:hypothetical protein
MSNLECRKMVPLISKFKYQRYLWIQILKILKIKNLILIRKVKNRRRIK